MMSSPPADPLPRERVLLLHGWGMSPWVMRAWARSLSRAGYEPTCLPWACWRQDLTANAAQLRAQLAFTGTEPVHWVGHSLGGLMALQLLATCPELPPGRIVMVGSPFQGSQVALRLGRWRAGRALLGRSLLQWAPLSAEQLPPGRQIGVIAGTLGLGMGRLFGGLAAPHDGTVTVAETRVPHAADTLCLPVSHTGMLWSGAVRGQIVQFLRHGAFTPDGRRPS